MRSVHIPNSRLTEGKTYPFLILKFVSLEPGEEWMVMQEPRGYKILVPLKYYTTYGFEPGQTVLCRVDKINCNGRMFLEPRHPVYEEGKVYAFELVEKAFRTGITNQPEWYFLVRDVLGNEWKVITRHKQIWDNPPDSTNCLIKRIKKGRLFLVPEGEESVPSVLEMGKSYTFDVVDEKLNPDDGHYYFILKDTWGDKHLLKKRYYRGYSINIGSKINCRVEKFLSEGYFFLEPEHPCYKIGEAYGFRVNRFEELVFTDGFRQKVLVLSDCLGEEVKVHIDEKEVKNLGVCEQVEARVMGINKSRLEVELMADTSTEN